jgi:hypothetical protein
MKININKAPGPNDPVLKILKEFADVLAAIIINNTLSYLGVNIPLKNARKLLNVCLDFANSNKQELIIKIS